MKNCTKITSCCDSSSIRKSILFIIILFLGMTNPYESEAQYWGGKRKAGVWDYWSINLNGGLTSFYGDLSIYDGDILKKLSYESGPALGGIIVKHLYDHKFGLGFQILHGQFSGENSGSSFEASLIEYNLNARIDFTRIIWPCNYNSDPRYNKCLKLGFEGYAGIGQFIFNSTRYFKDNITPPDEENTGTPEFVYFFGFQGYYDIKERFRVTLSMALRQARNDKLDVKSDKINFDYYTYMSLGVTYKIRSVFKSSGKGYRSKGRFPMRKRTGRPL
ncbi:MAG: hypothetical protein K8R53_00820 [Bacteroidales bacterium]|nr:hypothetical protein [Bacteroidales bacterium]